MSDPVGADAAWDLVRAVAPGRSGAATRVYLDDQPGVWLDVRDDGSWTASGAVSDDSQALFDLFVPLQLRSDLVIGQLGQSLDGRIATESGASHYVTGPEDIERLHRLRALVDAVIVGAGTVESDDPRLTVRGVVGDDPVRVVIDPSARLSPDRRVFRDSGGRTLVVRDDSGRSPTESPRAEVVVVPRTEAGGLDLAALLEVLRGQGLDRVLVEGGGITVSRFLQAGLLDRLHVTVAPVLIGSGRPSFTLPPVETLDEALRPSCRRFHLGDDVLFDLDLRSRTA